MIAVSSEGAISIRSQSGVSAVPPVPVKPMVTTPRSRAASSAAVILGERPDVVMPMNTSPFWPSPRTWRSNTSS